MPKAMAKGNATRPTVIPASRLFRKVLRVYHLNAKNDLGRFGLLMDMMLPSFYAHGRTRPASGGTRCSLPGSGPAIDPAPNKQNKTGCPILAASLSLWQGWDSLLHSKGAG